MPGGNTRFANNTDQSRCKHCNAYVSKGEADADGLLRYQCWRCGAVLERPQNGKEQASE